MKESLIFANIHLDDYICSKFYPTQKMIFKSHLLPTAALG